MSKTEQFLIDTLADLMKIEPAELSLGLSLEEQGIDSLVGLRLIRRIQKQTGVDVDLTRILDYPTLHELAGYIDAELAALAPGAAAAPPAIAPADRSQPLPLSWSQQRLWFLDRLDHAASVAYHLAGAVHLRGQLDKPALRAALDRIVARHEALRTRFVEVDGAPVQQFDPAGTGFALAEHDLGALAGHEREAAVEQHRLAEARAPFDLAQGPLIRGKLLRLAPDEHVLLITQHHIISDGWSIGVLIGELSTLYTAFTQGQPDPLPPLAIQYADYALWQRQWLQGQAQQAQLDFWRGQLAGAPALLELPTDRPRPAVRSHAGASLPLVFPAELTAGLRALGQRHGTTLFMTLLAGWAALLARLSGQTDVVIGTPTANRPRPEIESLIGFFVNTLALRVTLDADPSVAQLLAQVKAGALEAYRHQDLPFERVVEAVRPVRSMGHNPVFQVMLALDNTPGDAQLRLPGLAIRTEETARQTAQFDLNLSLTDSDGVLSGSLVYASELFDHTTVARWAGCFQTLLASMLDDDQQAVSRLALLPAAERERLARFNDTAVAYADARLVHQLVEEQAARRPDAPALLFGDASMSYGELNRRANQLAHYLLARGVKPDDRVAICMERSLEMVVGLLGILKAGAAYVPLDPAYPQERLAHILADCAPAALLSQSALRDVWSGAAMPVVLLDEPSGAWTSCSADNPSVTGLTDAHLAYVIYTSGSTGMPKGVMVEHRALRNLLQWKQEKFGFGAADVILQKTAFAFDGGVWEFWSPLLCGAQMVLAQPAGHTDPAYLVEEIIRRRVTAVKFIPTMLGMVCALPDFARCTSLKHVMSAGEPLAADLIRRFQSALPGVALHNLYGPTEATVDATAWTVAAAAAPEKVLIGGPIANVRVYILDRQLQPVPVGVTGEIHIGGAQVARGYLNREQLDKARFIPDPFSGAPGARMYKTGDLGRWTEDGQIECLGRNDFQVKIRGFRIELGEIEARLAACAGVREAVVIAREDIPGAKRLVAYLLAQDGAAPEAGELRRELGRHLAEYMVPSAFVTLDAYPLTPNGKLDREALPAPGLDAFAAGSYVAPQGEREQAIAAIWQELLGVERVGRDDDFFELGGHSLMAIQLVSRIRQQLGVDVPLRALFTQPTVAGLAALVAGAGAAPLDAIAPADRSQPLALSWAQQRLWFLDRLDHAASMAYHMPASLHLRGQLDKRALRAALDRIVARHEALRTRFADVGGAPVQLIDPAGIGFALVERDLGALAGDERASVVGQYRLDEATRPFDLSQGPLIRGQLLRLSEDEHVLLVTQHHIISDGWSVRVLIDEVRTLYTAFAEGRPDPLPPLALQYADYAAWQRACLQGPALEEQVGFWTAHLAGAPALLDLPTDHPRPAQQSYAGAAVELQLPAELTAALKALGRRNGTTLFMTLLAGWAVLMARLSGQDDVVIGTPVANRQRPELESLIGFFVNTLALRVKFDADPSVEQLLAQVKASALEAYRHQDLPFEQLVEALRPERSMGHNPIFQVMLAMNNTPGEAELRLPGLSLHSEESARPTAQFDLSLSLAESDGAISGSLVYASDLFEEATVRRMAGYFEAILRGMAADPRQAVGKLAVLGAAERQLLLHGLNDTRRAYPHDKLVHGVFEEKAASRPDAPALVCGPHRLSYAELNRRANRLAHHLRALGVGPDVRVAICIERGVEMVVGMLAVLKAGGAYVPIDPGCPAERLAYMLEDCAPRALLTGAAMRERFAAPVSATMPVLALDAMDAELALQPESNPEAAGQASSQLAYVIYTSGSTGLPKGSMIEHRNTLGLAIDNGFAAIGSDDCVAQCANPAFDASCWEIWGALLKGACLLVVPQPVVLDAARFCELLIEGGVTAMVLTVGLFNEYADALAPAFGRLNYLLVGGDALDPRTIARVVHGDNAPRHLVNVYGPSEATTIATTFEVAAVADGAGSIPIGRPIANARIYVLDQHLQPVPLGVAGEIYIGGACVGRGYLNRAALTAERFVADPFSGEAGARMYKTGDQGRWMADGNLDYLGRNDFQVKIRGFRIELGEIEARLAACAGVREALVVARDEEGGDRRLVAYLLAHDGATLEPAELRRELRQHLAEYMVPSAFVTLDAYPLTANGKLDRRALPAPGLDAVTARAYVAPQGEREEAIAAIWQDLLGLERVGRDDHFFDLGGHSLLAIQLVSRLRERFGVDVPLRALFAQPTVAGVAALAASAHAAAPDAIAAADRSRPLPLSWAQQRLWFLDRLDHAASLAYHMPASLRMRGRLDRGALRAALDRLVARHEVLRTRFVEIDGAAVQQVDAPETGFRLVERDLGALAGHEQAFAVAQYRLDEASTRFDLAQGPLIRGQLLRLSEDEHVLLITQHHIVSDGWSVGLLIDEVRTLYTAFAEGRPDPLPSLALQYADYAAWQRAWLQGAVLEEQVGYWTGHLAGAPALLDLPTDRPRPAQQSYAGAAVELQLTAELTQALKALGQRNGTTLFMTLLAGWAVLMARLSGQDDVVIGTPVANRQRPELESLIGFFVNTLALRVTLDADPSVEELLAQVKASALEAYRHQDLPFEQLVDALRPERSMSHNPIFQVMLAMNNTPGEAELRLPQLSLHTEEAARTTAQFDLSLSLSERDGAISGSLVYASDLFDESTVRRFAACLQTLLAAMAADPAARVSELAVLGTAERRLVLDTFNATARAYPQDQLLHGVFEAQAQRQPEATALLSGAHSLSYGELNRRANRLAHHLRGLGVGPEARVAICVERGVEMVVAMLAILKAGGGYVPLDPGYPAERLAYMLEDSAPRALLTSSALQAQFAAQALPVLALDAMQAELALQPESDPEPAGLTPAHLAYVIYTSGSTGLPKGVMIEHANAVNFVHWSTSYFSAQELARTLFATSINFDLSVFELFVPLAAGAQVKLVKDILADEDGALDGVTLINTVPSAISALLQAGRVPASVRTVNLAGEPLKRAVVEKIFGTTAVSRVVNLYAPSETTTYSTVIGMAREQGFVAHLGGPIANTRIYLLDRHLQPVPLGVAGEIYIGGAGVARGYLNRPELSAERFLADPFSAEPGARMYKTGDLGRWQADGHLDYLGRNDFQVKIRGFRIELGEIEARLAACAGVREAVVVAREEEGGDKRLVAYLLARDGAALEAAALRRQLARHLAEYMVPSAFVTLDAYPLTPNGKLDRKALPAPGLDAVIARAYAAPEGGREEAIAALWQELLGLDRVGRDDHFFELGGHSLMAIQLVSRLREQFGVEVPLRALFAQPTVAGLAALVAGAGAAPQDTIVPADRSRPLPLSWAQQRLWFLDQRDHAASVAYHMPAGLRLRGRLDKPALRATLDRIVARHEALRTRFVQVDGMPVQHIDRADIGFALRERDLGALAGHEQEFALDQYRLDESSAPFDLAQGPLIRGQLLRLADDEHVLLVTQHHIVSDGWSIGVLVDEVRTLYAAFSQGQPDPLPPLALQYGDYAQWQRGWLQGERLQRQVDFWTGHLAGAPALLELPLDRPRPPVQSFAGSGFELALPADLSQRLRELGRRHGTTMFMTLLAGWSVLLARLSGQTEVVTGSPVANRQRPEIEGLIGFFVNTLPLRVSVEDDPTVAQLLAQVRARTLDAYSHQDLPFDQVVEAVRPPRSTSHSPIFQVMLTMDNTPDTSGLSTPDLLISALDKQHDALPAELHLALKDDGTRIRGFFRYASDLFDAERVMRMAGQFERILAAMADDASRPVSRLAMLDQAETGLLARLSANDAPYPRGRLIHQVFEVQVRATPDAVALVCGRQRLTFDELNRCANQVAHALLATGVRPDQLVALCTRRSAEMVVGLLGILKAGAAYVPMDPENPADRLAYMLADCAPAAVLVQPQVQRQLAPVFRGLPMPVMAVEAGLDEAWPEHDPDAAALGLCEHNIAYVIYTSGSTGSAKGVMVEHHSAINFWEVMKRTTHRSCAQGAHVALNASFAFDMSLKGILQLLSGHCLFIVPQDVRADGAAMLQWLAKNRIDAFDCTPSQLDVLVAAGLLDHPTYRPVSVLIGGEALSAPTWQKLRASQATEFHNMYGPTECTVDATIGLINGSGDEPHIGRPLANARVYILDAHAQPVPLGAPGEIHIGGAGVARGYLNRPELSAERFVADPFSAEPGARMYKTGDLGRWTADGNVAYLGRNDFQVKLRGYRIELGEIEAKLRACDAVRDAVVVLREDEGGDKRLVAYLLAQADSAPTPAALREQLAGSLAEYMLPSAFVTLDAYPLTPNGKLDRRALPAPDLGSVAAAAYQAPEGEIETKVALIWQDLLGVERVGRTDNFFELGGHSLLAIQFVARAREDLQVEIGVTDIFQEPTLAGMAALIGQQAIAGFDEADIAAIESEMAGMSEEELRAWLEQQETEE